MKSLIIKMLTLQLTWLLSSQIFAKVKYGELANFVVISFKNIPNTDNEFYFTKTIWQRKSNLISIFHSDKEVSFEIKRDKIPANIKIDMDENYLVLRHWVNFLDYNDYLFKKGDSVSIEYRKGYPHISILNREVPTNDYSTDNLMKERFKFEKYSPIGKYFGAIILNGSRVLNDKNMLNNSKGITPKQIMERNKIGILSIKNELYNECKFYLKSYTKLLDSLKKNESISNEIFLFYKNKTEKLEYLIDVETGRMDIEKVHSVFSRHTNNQYGYPEIYYKQLVDAVEDKFITEKAVFLDLKDGVNKDYRQIYEEVSNSPYFPERDKNYLLTKEIKRIAQTFSKDDFLKYFKLYERDLTDTMLVNKMREIYFLEFDDNRLETTSLILVGNNKEKKTFDEIRKQHQGKIIYVDFWASWCGPCRAAFPHSVKLRESLKNKDVVFVYLSIDKSYEAWKKASEKEGLDTNSNSYLVVNVMNAEFMKQQKLEAIPRYMIFDKQGKLIYSNAPKVESKELAALLTKLAAQ